MGLKDEFGTGGLGLVEFEGVEAGAGREAAVEEVGEMHKEVLAGGLEVDEDEFGGIVTKLGLKGLLGWELELFWVRIVA